VTSGFGNRPWIVSQPALLSPSLPLSIAEWPRVWNPASPPGHDVACGRGHRSIWSCAPLYVVGDSVPSALALRPLPDRLATTPVYSRIRITGDVRTCYLSGQSFSQVRSFRFFNFDINHDFVFCIPQLLTISQMYRVLPSLSKTIKPPSTTFIDCTHPHSECITTLQRTSIDSDWSRADEDGKEV
jgi:hypothetical protein